jgi:hypothetical protein
VQIAVEFELHKWHDLLPRISISATITGSSIKDQNRDPPRVCGRAMR